MRPLKLLIDEIKIDLKQFTDDDRINYLDEYLQDKADDIRAALITSEYNTTGRLDDKYYQNACCIEVECLKQGCEIDGHCMPSGTVIWKTKNLPYLIEGLSSYSDLRYLGTDDYQHNFKRVSLTSFMNSDGDIFNKHDVYYYMVGNTAYFKNLPTSGVHFLCAIGLWSKPTAVCKYDMMKDIYPIPSLYKFKVMMRMDILKSWGYVTTDKVPTGEDDTIELPANAEKTISNQQ